MANMFSMEDKKPKDGQAVWYYFEPVGIFQGTYSNEFIEELGVECDIFHGSHGWLTDDVTHWCPEETSLVVDGMKFPSHCPKTCPNEPVGWSFQGDACTRCPIFNCRGEDPLMHPDEYNKELVREYHKWMGLHEDDTSETEEGQL